MGKTTTAVNLAACLAGAGYRCLLIDFDPQGNATSGLGVDKREHGGADAALTDPAHPDSWIEKTHVENLALSPSTEKLKNIENALRHEVDRHQFLKNAVVNIKDKFDYVLIDCPPSSGLLPMNALIAADEVIVPVQCEYYAMEGLAQVLDTLNVARSEHGSAVEVGGFLFTMYDPEIALGRDVIKEVLKHFESKTYKTLVPRDPVLGEAPSYGQPAIEYAPRSRGANAYVQFAREIIDGNK